MMPGNNDASDAPTGQVGNDASDTATDAPATAGKSESSTKWDNRQKPDQTAQSVSEADAGNKSSAQTDQSSATASAESSDHSTANGPVEHPDQTGTTGESADAPGFSDNDMGADTGGDPLEFGDQVVNDEDAQDGIESGDAESAESVQAQLQKAEARASDNWDRLLRLQAEMENQRKRAQNDVNKARKFALEGIVGDLLPVKDSLEMGLAAAQAEDADPKSIVEGAELTLKMLAQVFEKNNIIEVNPVDEKFNPEFHQAMSMQEVEGKDPNTVTSVMQKGYTLNDRLVRPALVMVAK